MPSQNASFLPRVIARPSDSVRRAAVLAFALLAGVAGRAATADDLRIGGTGAGLEILRVLAEAVRREHPAGDVQVLPSLGSSGGIRALSHDALDLAISGRPLKESERAAGLVAYELGRTPFVFAVSSAREVDALSMAEIVAIYAGETLTWPDGERIRVVLRPRSDSDFKLVRSLSPAMADAVDAADRRPGMLVALTDQECQEELERVPGAFGGTTLGQMRAEGRRLKALALDGVPPDLDHLADGRYPHFKTLYLIAPAEPVAAARRLIEFAASPQGRALLRDYGFLASPDATAALPER